jgi:hypothetical protein
MKILREYTKFTGSTKFVIKNNQFTDASVIYFKGVPERAYGIRGSTSEFTIITMKCVESVKFEVPMEFIGSVKFDDRVGYELVGTVKLGAHTGAYRIGLDKPLEWYTSLRRERVGQAE